MTIDAGSAAIGIVSPTVSCSSSASIGGFRTGLSGILLLHGVTAELIAKRSEHPLAEWIVLPRSEARVQRGGDQRQRHRPFDRVLHRPSSLAGVVDVGPEVRQIAVLAERSRCQLEQP